MTEQNKLTQVSSNKTFGGLQKTYSHISKELKCEMKFSIFLPAQSLDEKSLPVIYFLSGLTCNELNFVQKAGAQRLV
jgi:S-formylglutathione hydrolase